MIGQKLEEGGGGGVGGGLSSLEQLWAYQRPYYQLHLLLFLLCIIHGVLASLLAMLVLSLATARL